MDLLQPRLMFTVHNTSGSGPQNPRAAAVLTAMQGLAPSAKQPAGFEGPRIEVFESEEALAACLEKEIPSKAAVVLFDTSSGGSFTMLHGGQRRPNEMSQTHTPRWASAAYWGVQIHRNVQVGHCARFLRAIFGWRFRVQLTAGHLPWGPRETAGSRATTPSRRRSSKDRRLRTQRKDGATSFV